MQYHSESAALSQLPANIVVPDGLDLDPAFYAFVLSKLSSLGYGEVVETDAPEIGPFEYVSTGFEPFDDGGETKYRKTHTVGPQAVQFHPWRFLEAVKDRCSDPSNDVQVQVCSAMETLLDDPSFFSWFLFTHVYMRGEANSERLVEALGGRDVVENAILEGR